MERMVSNFKKWYEKSGNRIKFNKMCSKSRKKLGYVAEKTPKEVAVRYIKRKTRYHYSLEGQVCEYCGKDAQCRHHTTDPIEFDKFEFVCNKCHKKIHSATKLTMGVKQWKQEK